MLPPLIFRQEERDAIDETFWILEQRAVAGVWIHQLGVSDMFE
jgi:hypothetical protein